MISGEVDVGARAARRRVLPHLACAVLALAVCALFAWNVWRTWFLSDDAFISFRYARNLADGLGPVWNPDERVEGYTNFSWVLLMAAGIRLGLQPEVLANVLGVACGVGVLVAAFTFARRGRSHESPWPWLLVLTLAASRSFAAWCTGGLETMLFTLLVLLGFARVLATGEWNAGKSVSCSLLFAGAALTRPEGLLFASLAFACLVVDLARARRSPREVALWLVPLAVVAGAHFAFRRAYYGAWLPNTFHAKVAGLWFEQGWRYLSYFHGCYRIGWFLPLALAAVFGAHRRAAATIAFVLAAYFAYVLAVGGDLFELRFFVHVFPLLYWLLVEGLASLADLAARPWRSGAPVLGISAAAALGSVALLATTHLGFDRVPGNRFGLQTVEGIDQYTRKRMDEGRTLREAIERGALPRDVVLCVGGAGAVPYYTRWTTVDRRGLNDATIARISVARHGLVGHEHDAPYDYLVARHVAVFDYFNQMLVKRQGLPQLRGPYEHDGHVLAMRAIELGERALVFATFVDDAELARLFPGAKILTLGS